ncbi:hypothetical protein [Enterococcus sp. AZ101]|uniref:hypothetical protein n=1 Tax=Enterococcus sp. AZ101 TaxID=2774742 RepID=UPI003D2AC60D
MKKKILLLALTLLTLSGCAEANGHDTLNKLDKDLVWQEAREKPFGKYDYGKLNEKKFNSLLKEKFKVEIPTYYKDVKINFEKEFVTEQVKLDHSEYFLASEGETLHLRVVSQYNKGEEAVLYTTTKFEYLFDREKKRATLRNQSITIQNTAEDGKFPKENIDQLILNMGQAINAQRLDSKLEEFNNLKEKGKIKNQVLVIYDNSDMAREKNELQKVVSVKYGSEGVLREIYFFIVDVIDEEV